MNEINKDDKFKMNRRTFVKAAGAAVGAFALGVGGLNVRIATAAIPLDGTTLPKYKNPLLIPPAYTPDKTTVPGSDYYEIEMTKINQDLGIFNSVGTAGNPLTPVWAYGSIHNGAPANYPGFSIEASKNMEVVVKYKNLLPTTHLLPGAIDTTLFHNDPDMINNQVRCCPHLHGGFTAPQFDGHPESWFTPEVSPGNAVHGSHYFTDPALTANPWECVYRYSNLHPSATLWYHDHGMGVTRLNVYAGLAGFYLVRDQFDTGVPGEGLNIPKGNFEIPIAIQDRMINDDGTLFYPTTGVTSVHPIWAPEFFGDIAVVNGRVFPYLDVEPRRYRLRVLNGCDARFVRIWFDNKGVAVPFHLIGMEIAKLPKPVMLKNILLSPAERADIIMDFSALPMGTEIILKNDAPAPYPGGGEFALPEIMKFRVNKTLSSPDETSRPEDLELPPFVPLSTVGATKREIVLRETEDPVTGNPLEVLINGKYFMDPVDETPTEGTTEIWQFVNLTPDAHPMHTHLVDFQVLNRQKFLASAYKRVWDAWKAGKGPKPVLAKYLIGSPRPPLPEESGLKDTAKAFPNEVLRIIARFDVPPGSLTENQITGQGSGNYPYVYHCHIIEHEDNEMMRPFEVVPK